MKVMKFGGTSVGTAQRIKELSGIIPAGEPVIIVLSAMSGTTNALISVVELIHKNEIESAMLRFKELEIKYYTIVNELFDTQVYKKRGEEFIKDMFGSAFKNISKDINENDANEIVALGELLSTGLFHMYLTEQGIRSAFIPALNFMRTDKDKEPDTYYIAENLKRYLDSYPKTTLFITQGFICRNVNGSVDNLGRGGSDYTAAIIGAAIDAGQVEIWTDIDGIHNNDPRFVEDTSPLRELSFDEAAELAYFGAKILHPLTIHPCSQKGIPVILKNTLKPDDRGTIISRRYTPDGIKAIAAKDGITSIRIRSSRMLMAYGFLKKVFEIFEEYKTPVDMITTSEVSVSLTIDNTSNIHKISDKLSKFSSIEVDSGQTIICVVGDFSTGKSGYANLLFNALKDIPVRMISYGGSDHNISILIDSDKKVAALKALHPLVNINISIPI